MYHYIVLLIFALLKCCEAQECKTGCELGLSTCTNIDYLIYVPEDISQVPRNESIARYLLESLNVSPSITAECRKIMHNAACHMLHPACSSSSSSPVPVLSCVQMCHDLRNNCAAVFDVVPNPLRRLFNCTDSAIYTLDSPTCSTLNNTAPLCAPAQPSTYGACQPYNASLAPTYGDACAPFVSKQIYVPVDSPDAITLLDEWAANTGLNSPALKFLAPISPVICSQHILATKCSLYFPPCVELDFPAENVTAYVGAQTCRSFCEYSIDDVCGEFLTKVGIGSVYAHLCRSFPRANTSSFNISSTLQATLPCRSNISELFPPDPYADYFIPNFDCPFGTGKKLHPSETDPFCGLQCPDSSYSMDEWRRLVLITRIGAGLSVACMSFLIILYLLNKERRHFPYTLHINQFAATLLFCASFFIGGVNPEKSVWCTDAGTYATQQSNYWCAAQGTAFILFGTASTAWSTVNAYVVYFIVVVQSYNKGAMTMLLNRKVYIFVFAWGTPFIFAFAAVGWKKVAYGPPLAWCFVNFTAVSQDTVSPDYILFYIPNAILISISAFLFCRIVLTIIFLRRTHTRSISAANQMLLNVTIRCLLFILCVFCIGFTLLEWRFKIQFDNKSRQIGLNWTYCKIATQILGTEYKGDCPGDVNPARINYPHTVFESLLLSGLGALFFLAFGSDPNLLAFVKVVSLFLKIFLFLFFSFSFSFLFLFFFFFSWSLVFSSIWL
eukprot:Phypoly_transcript_03744.p1 GENE.Phypoly_transcript_03744~~Phypoly_transcript_03744.p1  ORF type:complete len:726 (+),score=31.94 Phypoly_transcript_03744:49-2226(+)